MKKKDEVCWRPLVVSDKEATITIHTLERWRRNFLKSLDVHHNIEELHLLRKIRKDVLEVLGKD